MTSQSREPSVPLRTVLDAVPSSILVVDENLRIVDCNRAAEESMGLARGIILRYRVGEALHCIQTDEGCGCSKTCHSCVIRNSVDKTIAGKRIVRHRTRMLLKNGAAEIEFHALITTSTFDHNGRRLVLLVIEDISQTAEAHQLIPICIHCKKIRTDEQYWLRLEKYFGRNWAMKFTHGICPDCFEVQMGVARSLRPDGGESKASGQQLS